jgi:dihydroxy-acid dehydratase
VSKRSANGVYEAGGKPGVFAVNDICDGVVQATDGMSYSLISRDIMAAMVEIPALGHPHDGMVLISGNDRSVPAHLLAIARGNLPAIHLPGGTQLNAPDYVTSEEMWPMGAAVERGELGRQDLERAQRGACPTCGRASSWAVRARFRPYSRPLVTGYRLIRQLDSPHSV